MNLAFCLFNYFPYGGLQRDFLHIARECRQRDHQIHVYTMCWKGEPEPNFHLHVLGTQGWQNHTRCQSFTEKVKLHLDAAGHDLVIGFNKMPHLDVYYAADVCYQARAREKHSFLYRLLPRYRKWIDLEKAVFTAGNKTQIMVISPYQQKEYMACYQTETHRFHTLPPVLSKDRIMPENAQEIRARVRKAHQISEEQLLLVLVASRFKTKGLDRAILGFASLPAELRERCQFIVIGEDSPKTYRKLAEQLGVSDKIHFLGGRQDVPNFLMAADLLVHPAYLENTGTVLLEAMVLGLPVLTLDVCGYAHYVKEAQAGIVLQSPFQQTEFNFALQKMLLSPDKEDWRKNALLFGQREDIYNMPKEAASIIESVKQR